MTEKSAMQKTICDILGVEPGEKFRYIDPYGEVSKENLVVTGSDEYVAKICGIDGYLKAVNEDVVWDLINHPQLIVRADGSHPPVPDYKFDEYFLPIPRACELLGVKPNEPFTAAYKNGAEIGDMSVNYMGHHTCLFRSQMTEIFDSTEITIIHQWSNFAEESQISPDNALKEKLSMEYHKSTSDWEFSIKNSYHIPILFWLQNAAKDNKLLTPMQVGILIRTPYLYNKTRNILSDDWVRGGCDTGELEGGINKIIYENATPKEREQLMSEAKTEINEYVKSNAGNIKGQHIMALMSETDNPNWDDVFAVRQEIHQLDRCRFAERELHLNKEQPNKNSMVR